MSLDGVLYPVVVEEAKLKPGLIPTHNGPVRTMSELKNAAKLVYTSLPHLQCISTKIQEKCTENPGSTPLCSV